MKKKRLNSEQLGLISAAFLKCLFPKPLKGELFVDESNKDGSCILYFSDDYHCKLDIKIREKYFEGTFAKSNAEDKYIELMKVINTAEETSDDTTGLKYYWISLDPDEENKPKIEIDKDKLSEILNSERLTKRGWIGDVMGNLSDDLRDIYVGHSLSFNYRGYIALEREIDIGSTFATNIDLAPMLRIFEKYKVVINRLEIKKLSNPEKINATIYLEK
jgi:hypothetical protein